MADARILHSVAVQERAVAADGVEINDLAVNPLSVVLLAIRPLNDTGTLTNYQRYLGIVGALDRVSIKHRGQSIVEGSGRDLAALNYHRYGIVPKELNPDDANDERRCVILPIILGRFPFDPDSCFPASKRGELTLELAIDVADTGYDGFRYSVETVELLGVTPKEFERKISIAQTFAATGDQIFPLPTGNVVRGLLGFGTTGFTGATPAPTWGRFGLWMDNQQIGISSTDVEVCQTLSALMGRQPPSLDLHTHRVTTDGNAQADLESTGPIEQAMGGWENYWFYDLDPTRDDMFSINTAKALSFQLRANVETADAARVMVIEKVQASKADM